MRWSGFIRKAPGVILLPLLILIAVLSFLRVYSRVKITLLGYEIGRMREIEEQLLKKRSLLTMEYAKLTTRQSLESRARQADKKEDDPVPLADR